MRSLRCLPPTNSEVARDSEIQEEVLAGLQHVVQPVKMCMIISGSTHLAPGQPPLALYHKLIMCVCRSEQFSEEMSGTNNQSFLAL